MAPVFERTLLTLKKQLAYPGVTRLQLVEPIPNGTATYNTRFQDICMPEALLIFCLDKQVASGTYSFATSTKENVFLDHNIQSVDLSFDGKRFNLKEPHMGNFRNGHMDSKGLFDHLAVPPFGVNLDPTVATFEKVKDGGISTFTFPSFITAVTRADSFPPWTMALALPSEAIWTFLSNLF